IIHSLPASTQPSGWSFWRQRTLIGSDQLTEKEAHKRQPYLERRAFGFAGQALTFDGRNLDNLQPVLPRANCQLVLDRVTHRLWGQPLKCLARNSAIAV